MPVSEDKEKDVLRKIQLIMERFDGRFQKVEDRLNRIENKTDALHFIVAGNGSNDSLVMRLAMVEAKLANVERRQEKDQAEVCAKLNEQSADIEALQTTEIAWRNRFIGVVSLLTLINAVLALWSVFGG